MVSNLLEIEWVETYDSGGVLLMKPWEECPSFDVCAVNKRPLHPDYLKLRNEPGDPETKCRALRRTREDIAARYPGLLPTQGVLRAELTSDKRSLLAKARWNALTPEEQAEKRDELAKYAFKKKVKQ